MDDETPSQASGDGDEAVVVRLPAAFDIASVSELHPELAAALDGAKRVIVDGSDVERADTAALQLLVAFEGAASGAQANVTWRLSEAARDAARRLGFEALADVAAQEGETG